MFNWIIDPQSWIALVTLTGLEIILGIDNIIFLTILVGKLPKNQQAKGRIIGLGLAMGTRILLLLSIVTVMQLTRPFLTILTLDFSGQNLIFIVGGLFLIAKSTHEIHNTLEGPDPQNRAGPYATDVYKNIKNFWRIMIQIAIIDIIFSLDSVMTAVGLANQLVIMILAIMISVIIMIFASKAIGDYIDKHPTLKMLALSFLILIGVSLLGAGFGFYIPKGYLYFAMAFSFGVEMLNLRLRSSPNNTINLRSHKK